MRRRVLITGMSSHQYSQRTAERTESFSYLLSKCLSDGGCDVDMCAPLVSWDTKFFSNYDAVMVGVSPPMSVASNGAYGALAAVSKLNESHRVTLFSDLPEMWKIFSNIRSLEKSPSQMFKEFYKKRIGYSDALSSKDTSSHVENGLSVLAGTQGQKIVVPMLPWNSTEDVTGIPDTTKSSLVSLNLDYQVFKSLLSPSHHKRNLTWIVDGKSKWVRNSAQSLTYQTIDMRDVRPRTSKNTVETIRASYALLIGPHDDGLTWWSPRYAQSLAVGTAVATDWKNSASLGRSWSRLPCDIENLSDREYADLLNEQRSSYIDSIPTEQQSTKQLLQTLEIQ